MESCRALIQDLSSDENNFAMHIEKLSITIRDLVKGFEDNGDEGVVGYGGQLDIRPSYQREFVYDALKQEAVIDSVMKGFPLNAMYWAPKENGGYEVLDGQQRTLSICSFYVEDLDYKKRYFTRLLPDEKEKFLNYELMVFVCHGSPSEKLQWFETINISNLVLTNQELRNATYAGPWVNDAKRYFSKRSAPAAGMAKDYLTGEANRQAYLETAIKWAIGDSSDDAIRGYMNEHCNESSANQLWLHFQSVINWVAATFTKKRSYMKGVDWGSLYDKYHTLAVDQVAIEARCKKLFIDDDVTNKKGVYEYVLSGDERKLNIRAFSTEMKLAAYERQEGICPICEAEGRPSHYEFEQMEGDHITPWSQGGKTNAENCKMLCRECNRRKSDK